LNIEQFKRDVYRELIFKNNLVYIKNSISQTKAGTLQTQATRWKNN
jgi:hypothetical protein